MPKSTRFSTINYQDMPPPPTRSDNVLGESTSSSGASLNDAANVRHATDPTKPNLSKKPSFLKKSASTFFSIHNASAQALSSTANKPSLAGSVSNPNILSETLTKPSKRSLFSRSKNNSRSSNNISTTSKNPTPNASTTNFELTPMSKIITQSYTDINKLRILQDQRITAANLAAANLSDGSETVQVKVKVVDFDRVEENLRRFEEMYNQFLRYGSSYGDEVEEVHLVAMLCYESKVDRRRLRVEDVNEEEMKEEERQETVAGVPDCCL